jgi:hypothetical protein
MLLETALVVRSNGLEKLIEQARLELGRAPSPEGMKDLPEHAPRALPKERE